MPSAPLLSPAEADPGVGARRKQLRVVESFSHCSFPPGSESAQELGWSLRTGAQCPSLHARWAEGRGGQFRNRHPRISHQRHLGSLALSSVCKHPV